MNHHQSLQKQFLRRSLALVSLKLHIRVTCLIGVLFSPNGRLAEFTEGVMFTIPQQRIRDWQNVLVTVKFTCSFADNEGKTLILTSIYESDSKSEVSLSSIYLL